MIPAAIQGRDGLDLLVLIWTTWAVYLVVRTAVLIARAKRAQASR